jgi:hypothetical protein
MKSFISLRDFSYEQLTSLLDRADYLRTLGNIYLIYVETV